MDSAYWNAFGYREIPQHGSCFEDRATLGKGGSNSLFRTFPLSLLIGALLIAGPASAVTTTYDMTGSTMVMTNQVCLPCTVAVTGSLTLDDDRLGNVTITSMNLAHDPYQVASPSVVSVILDRDSITLGAGPLAGTGTTVGGAALFRVTTLAQTGTVTCTGSCSFLGLPVGVTTLTPSVFAALGTWAFDLLGNLTAGPILYTPGAASETLNLVGTPVPEPGTALFMAAGLVGMAVRRRAER